MPEVEFCESSGGRPYVLEDLKKLGSRDPEAFRKIMDDLELLKVWPLNQLIKLNFVEQLKGRYKKIHEFKSTWNKIEYRIFFRIIGAIYWMSNLYIKKDEKTRRCEIEKAQKRLDKL